ncbi:MAG TPA: hypothetical protein PLU10_06425 [Chitinophagaceae bacterium]|nr:hypothetical protein [Chitinophagaceae bacterium]
MKKVGLFLILLSVSVQCFTQNTKISTTDSVLRKIQYMPKLSIMSVLSEKEKYDGKWVKISGYLKITKNFFGGLYFSKEFADIFSYDNAIYFEMPYTHTLVEDLRRKNNNYVTIIGIINFKRHGIEGEFIAEFDQIHSVGPVW